MTNWRLQRGFSLYGLGLMAILISVLAVLLLKRLYYYQEVAEKVRVDLTLKSLNEALKLRMGQLMIADKAYRWRELTEENPFDWFEKKPAGYCGEVSGSSRVEPGCWVYRLGVGELAYRPINAGHLQTPGRSGLLRYRVVAKFAAEADEEIKGIKESTQTADTLSVEPVERYRWLEQP